jgi:hypothetical protein
MNVPRTIIRIVVAALCAFLAGCSSVPTEAGGTHVGNPEMAMAARSFKAFALNDRWCLSTYIPGGRSRLDPTSIISRTTSTSIGSRLAKTAAATAADTQFVFDTLFHRDTSVHNRTLVKPDTMVVKDTLYQVVLRRDTTDTLIDSITTRVVTLNTVTDSFYVNDTLITNDTLEYQDTIVATDTLISKRMVVGPDTTAVWAGMAPAPDIQIAGSSPPAVANFIQYSMDAASISVKNTPSSVTIVITIPARMVTDSSVVWMNTTTPVNPSNVRVDSMKTMVSVFQNGVAADRTPIQEQYTDIDADGGLLTARPGSLPRIAFTSLIKPPLGGSQSTSVLYGSGADGNVRTVDHDIVELLTQTSTVSSGSEQVTYSIDTAHPSDTAIVRIQSDNPTDSIECVAATYTLVRDPDSTQAFDGRLSSVRQITTYRIGEVHRVDVSITPLSAAVRGMQPKRGLVTATVSLVDGTQARLLDGKIDLDDGIISGTWVKGDNVRTVSLDSLGREATGAIIWKIP